MSMISIQKVSKTYGKHKVLEEVSLDFLAGQSVALIGPNGSGKTTLIKSILGLIIPDSGTIEVLDQDITLSPYYRRKIGYMPQMSRFPEQMKVRQLFLLIKRIREDVSKNDYDLTLYDDFQIGSMEDKSLGTLSGGMKQQVSAALAFYFRPDIVILDEPTAGLDPISNEILKNKVNHTLEENRLVITTSHVLNDLEEICNHVVYLMEGKVLLNDAMTQIAESTGEVKLNKMVVKFLNKIRIDE